MTVTRKQLYDLDFYCSYKNRNEWFYDSWEYMYIVSSREFYWINDGVGEPQLIAKIDDLDHLKQVLEALNYNPGYAIKEDVKYSHTVCREYASIVLRFYYLDMKLVPTRKFKKYVSR